MSRQICMPMIKKKKPTLFKDEFFSAFRIGVPVIP